MKKADLTANKELVKAIEKVGHYSIESFEKDARAYVSAIKQGRMINVIGSVSSSGMSRTIKFTSNEKSKYKGGNAFYQRNYSQLFLALGFKYARNDRNGYFQIGGCGMDMIFHTNYTIIHRLERIGLLTKKECDKLSQQTPNTI